MADVLNTRWHNFPSITLESELMRVVIVPDLGAKIVSIFDKNSQHEWLVPPMRPLKQMLYGVDFVSQDMSGWDEMMPTIVACAYEGASLPDHGEVWSIPWQVQQSSTKVGLSVDGRALPYRFARAAELLDGNRLELSYTLTNTGQTSFPYLWAAHPQFAADTNTRIILPPEVRRLVNVVENDPCWGAMGSLHAWPAASSTSGQLWQLDRVRSAKSQTCRKFYIPPEMTVAWAALAQEELGCQLRLDWSADKIPYLGLWVDEGTYNTAPVAALEPSNGYYDSLERAVNNKKVPVLEPGKEVAWKLQVSLSRLAE